MNPRHQPAPRRPVARLHRRSHPRRRHPRPPHPRQLPHRPQGRLHAPQERPQLDRTRRPDPIILDPASPSGRGGRHPLESPAGLRRNGWPASSESATGGKPLPGRGQKVFNRAGQALRQAAANARCSESFIGATHRARLARMDARQAIKATAHQLARLIYALLTRGSAYVERGIEAFEEQRRERQLRALQRKAAKLGVGLVMPV